MARKIVFVFLLLSAIYSYGQIGSDGFRSRLDLSGTWQFSLDTADAGIMHQWYLTDLQDSVVLPGTTDLNRKGYLTSDSTTFHLSRVFKYEGVAWYRKRIVLPANFNEKHIELFLERTKCTQVWIDGTLAGTSRLLQSPQVFDVSEMCKPGEHTITIRVDNRLKNTPYGNVHIYSDDTQTNWNGIIGMMYLEASNISYISDIQVFPDITQKKANIRLAVVNNLKINKIDIQLQMSRLLNGKEERLKTVSFSRTYEPQMLLTYDLGPDCRLWDEFEQPLYKLTVVISIGGKYDARTVIFGMRRFSANGTQFAINGRNTFLRGKHDACVFPLTGCPPTDEPGWEHIFRIARSYGINHYRFHSYCPPEAAFEAADRVGMYLQAELPFWGGLDSDTIARMLLDEGLAMLKAYANHPSFVMLSHGNELWSGLDRVEHNILKMKQYDDRVLYSMGSNNNIGYALPLQGTDFHVAARVPYSHDTTLVHTRLTHAFADAPDGGILNTQYPGTRSDYSFAVSQIKMPLISHEIGQYQVFPDFLEMKKYTGVLQARNLEVFKIRLEKAGMADQAMAFHKASGAWAAICYKAEMEAALRTKGLAGFQLLDLQDYPGQGTALVGMLDAFMDSKQVVDRNCWLESCNDVTLLLRFPKYCYTNNEIFSAKAEVANYSNRNLTNAISWKITNKQGTVFAKGSLRKCILPNGALNLAGLISCSFSKIKKAEQLTVTVQMKGTPYANHYSIWVYPQAVAIPDTTGIVVAGEITATVFSKLESGARVLLFPSKADVSNNSVPGLFPPDFWNYGMFKGISEWVKKPVSPGTLGILTDPGHPVFRQFPTDSHTNWQWFSIIKAANPLILDCTPASYRPVIQVIDNLERDHKLGLLFEFQVGKGKLLICMSPLPGLIEKPECRQLYVSILDYMLSPDFAPTQQISRNTLFQIMGK